MVKQAKNFTATQVPARSSQNSRPSSTANARYGLQSITDLLPRVIDQYDFESSRTGGPTIPASERARPQTVMGPLRFAEETAERPLNPAANPTTATITLTTSSAQQATFGWE